ncbi:DUF4349 domain-containing protein [Streptomyces sp. TP-A0356]|uniref:DUF4349 domain-containing protein n=1 Tax=Streptomyces sp. TP-A0356 TaxID=1359208 RepID=UPI0006E3E079|nr:DUF4349 domain-containing protein [Streptomyces sp. TP-A0356]
MRMAHSARPVQVLAATLLTGALALAGCSAGHRSTAGDSGARAAAPAQRQGAAAGATGGAATGRAAAPALTANDIIRTASLTVQVEDVPKALGEARTTAENAGGFVGDESTSRDSEGHERTRLVLRVPVEKYDEVLAALQGAGRLVDRTAKAEDVTDQVVDVDSRIGSQRASVARVRALMDKAADLSDVVTLEGELSSREAELEALLARQASLKDRARLATITLSLSPTPVRKAAGEDRPGFTDALAGGWHVFVTLLRWLALALGAALPFAVLAALLVLVWVRLVRTRLPRGTAAVPAPTAPGPLPGARTAPEHEARGERD